MPLAEFSVQRIKGKQVRILYDPVTVTEESVNDAMNAVTEFFWEDSLQMMILKSGNLPVIRYI